MKSKLHLLKNIKSSLTRKLIAVSLLATLIPFLSWGIIFYNISMKNVEREYLGSVSNNLVQLKSSFNEHISMCRQIAQSFAGDDYLVNFLQYGSETDFLLIYNVNDNIISRLQTILVYNENFHTVRLIHGNRDIPDVYDNLFFDARFKDSWWQDYFKSIDNDAAQNGYFINLKHPEDSYFELPYSDNVKKEVFSFYYPIYSSFDFNTLVAVMEISILSEDFFSLALEQKLSDGAMVELIKSDGEVVFSTDENHIGILDDITETSSLKRINNTDYFIVKTYIEDLDSWLVQYTPTKLLYKNNTYRTLMLIGIAAVLITTISISVFVFRALLANLNKLTKTIHRIKDGDLDARAEVKSADEVGELAKEFNEMTEEISELIDKVETTSKAEKEAIYIALENQISPHFICNALDTLRMTAETKDDRPIADALEMISSYFMYNIYKRERSVTIVEELKNVTDYISIHNLIRKDKIEFAINIDDRLRLNLDKYHILKFSLQPIIENSIKHGFVKKTGRHLIVIEVKKDGDVIHVSVEDNGDGMDKKRLEEVNSMLSGSHGSRESIKTSGIGLENIKDRFDIEHAQSHSITVESYADVGTKITLTIPAY